MAEISNLGTSIGANQDGELFSSLAGLFDAVAQYSGGASSNASSSSGPTSTLDGEVEVWGDPHVEGELSLDGEEISFNYITEGGSGDTINMLDTDNLDYTSQFDQIRGEDPNTTWQTENTITAGDDTIVVNADDTVTVNGEEIEDGTYELGGNTITKSGDTTTIETADGQKITITDQGDHLDTKLELDGLETSEVGGMIGDTASGEINDNAEDYVTEANTGPIRTQMSSEATAELLSSLAAMLEGTDQDLSNMLASLSEYIGQSQNIQTATA